MSSEAGRLTSPLVAAWRMAHEVNLFVLGALPASHVADRYAARTRTVAGQFAHLHAVRIRWLKHAAPELAEGIVALPDGEPTAAQLKKALRSSAKAIEAFLEQCEQSGRVRGWKGPPASFLGYLVAHEAHHRGLAMVAMRRCGRKLPQSLVYGQWDWGKGHTRR